MAAQSLEIRVFGGAGFGESGRDVRTMMCCSPNFRSDRLGALALVKVGVVFGQ